MVAVLEIIPHEPTDEDRNQILKLLLQFNGQHTAHVNERPNLAVVLKDPGTSKIVGGLYATDEYNWLSIKYLIVPDSLRGKGLASRLMEEAERVAIERGYFGIFLDTYDFQARPFYLKLGFEQFGELEGNEETPRRYFLKKRLRGQR